MEVWHQQGARPKGSHIINVPRRAASAADLSRKQDSPSPRVHFEDEVYMQNGLGDRTVSQPELWKQEVGKRHHGKEKIQPNMHEKRGVYDDDVNISHTSVSSNTNGPLGNNHSGQVLHQRLSQSEQVLHTGQSASVRLRKNLSTVEIDKWVVKSRSRSVTPSELSDAIFSDSDKDIESSMEIHRASPAIVLPPRKPLIERGDSPSSEIELAHEIGYYNKLYEDINASKMKKSKKPWKRNKGYYTPSEEVEKVQTQLMQRSSSTQSLASQKSKDFNGSVTGKPPASKPPVGSKPPVACKKPPLPPQPPNRTVRATSKSTQSKNGNNKKQTLCNGEGSSALADCMDGDNPYEDIDVQATVSSRYENSSSRTQQGE